MKQKVIFLSIATLAFLGLTMPFPSKALSGVNIKKTYVKVYTEQGDDWFKIRKEKTDEKGVLKLKDVLPGKYKMTVSDDDEEDVQYLAVDLRMLDEDGRRLRDKTDVKLYVYVNGAKIYIKTEETDDKGWMRVGGLSLDTEYYIDVIDESKVKKEDGELRIKTKAKIDDSEWFQGSYSVTENGVLKTRNVLSGKYKFRAKDGSAQTFTLKAQIINDKGKVAENSNVSLYAYINNFRVFIGKVMTDEDGWLILPNVATNMKYKISVD